jgi:hypothetical protein
MDPACDRCRCGDRGGGILIVRSAVAIAPAIAEHFDDDDRGTVIVRLGRRRRLLRRRSRVRRRECHTDVWCLHGRDTRRRALHLDVRSIENLQRCQIDIARDADDRFACIDGAARCDRSGQPQPVERCYLTERRKIRDTQKFLAPVIVL